MLNRTIAAPRTRSGQMKNRKLIKIIRDLGKLEKR